MTQPSGLSPRSGRGGAGPLAGTVVAVTGGAHGIGRSVSRALAAAGAQVALGDIDAEAARTVAAQITAAGGGRATGLPLDVTDTSSFEAFYDAAEAELGTIDVLVNNAGIMWVGPFVEEPEHVAQRQFEVNVHGVLRGMKIAASRMRTAGGGHIVNIASAASKLAPKGEATYAATKHAVYGYSTAARAELRGSGVEVSLVMPGVVDTDLAVGTSQGPTRRLLPEDVADGVLRVVRRPRPELYLPRHLQIVPTVAALLPARVRALWLRALVPDQVSALTDPTVRVAYERRTSGSQPNATEQAKP